VVFSSRKEALKWEGELLGKLAGELDERAVVNLNLSPE
jgi:hypothetical protein